MKVCKHCVHRLEHGFCRKLERHVPKKVVMGKTESVADHCPAFVAKSGKRGDK